MIECSTTSIIRATVMRRLANCRRGQREQRHGCVVLAATSRGQQDVTDRAEVSPGVRQDNAAEQTEML
jgi:hypothetical protein